MLYIKGFELEQKNIVAELSEKKCWNNWKHWLNPLLQKCFKQLPG
ncbi:MAG TPA: hypothetical protein PK566_00025 [Pseudobacteroides sp.]|nr:hypothetical protein [Pseudobacteroides sp.]